MRQSRRLAALTDSDSAKPAQESKEAAESEMPQSGAAAAAAAVAMADGQEAGHRPTEETPSLVQGSTMYASANVLRGLVRATSGLLCSNSQSTPCTAPCMTGHAVCSSCIYSNMIPLPLLQ